MTRPARIAFVARILLAVFAIATAAVSLHGAVAAKPNVVLILADDLGYGDVRCLNPEGKITTPEIDRLAAAGMVFTDAHSSSAVCTPTRYGLMTGRYNWRSRLKSGVLGGMSPPLIEPGRLTLPRFLQQQGYHTACIGKWHLGLGWQVRAGEQAFDDRIEKGEEAWRADFTRPIAGGPISVGFDRFFGIAASLDMVPYTFIEDDHVAVVPTLTNDFPMIIARTNGATRRGPAAAGFEAEAVLPALTAKAIAYLEGRAADAKAGRPFFLYLPLNSPHTPIAPTAAWRGKSGINAYADFVMQTDASIGEVLGALDRLGLARDTWVIVASDNGCSPAAQFSELRAKGHEPSGPLRGAKADIFEGGHRIPLVVRWPGRVKAGTRSDRLVCLNDVFATCAEIIGKPVPPDAAEDSISFLPVLEGRSGAPMRETLVHHSIDGSFAVRQGGWKLELCPDSGGWSRPVPGGPASAKLPPTQLYDLARDPAETDNIAAAHPEVVARLTGLLERYITEGRSTPGPSRSNTGPVQVRRPDPRPAASAKP